MTLKSNEYALFVIRDPPHTNISVVECRKTIQGLELYLAVWPLIMRYAVLDCVRIPQAGSRN